jgi:hypothetical protein
VAVTFVLEDTREVGKRRSMKQTLYEAILEDEAALEDSFRYEVLVRQAEASGDQDLTESLRQVRDENRRRAERAERLLAQRLPEKKILRK